MDISNLFEISRRYSQVKVYTTGINDSGGKFAPSVNDWYQQHQLYWWQNLQPVSLIPVTLVANLSPGVNDTGKWPPVSTTLVANLPLVSMTLAANFATSTTGVVDTSGKFATGVVDTGGKFASGVVDTGGKFAAGVIDTDGDTGGSHYLPPVSTK